MTEKLARYDARAVEDVIVTVRGQKVILDADLAAVYGVPTKRLNEQVTRNPDRFPPDFAFVLTAQEVVRMRSQFATASTRNIRYRPCAFTEHGAIMAATVLNSPRAVAMSVFVVRAFVNMRRLLGDQGDLARKLADLERKLTARLDVHETAIVDVLRRIMSLLNPPDEPVPPEPPPKKIGFGVREPRARYGPGRRRR